MKVRAVLNGLIVFLLVGSVWSQDPAPTEAPLLKPNYSWTFVNVDGVTKVPRFEYTMAITEVDDTSVKALSKSATRSIAFAFDRNLTLIQRDGEKISSPVPRFQFPLIVGTKWEYSTENVHPRFRDTVKTSVKAEVKGWEEITVPAGSFRALRVDHEGSWSRSGETGRITQTWWYVPELRYFVRYELVDYAQRGRIDSSTIEELKATSIN